MSGFLSGLVQRGASLAGGTGAVLSAAPLAPVQGVSSLGLDVVVEAPSAAPAPPVDNTDPLRAVKAFGPAAHEEPLARPAEQHLHVTNVTAMAPTVIRESTVMVHPPAAPAAREAAEVVSEERPRADTETHLPQRETPASRQNTPVLDAKQSGIGQGTPLEPQPADSAARTPLPAGITAREPSEPRTTELRRAAPSDRELPETRLEPAPIESPALRRLDLQPAPAIRAPQPPPIHVRIGKVEVRPPAPAIAPPPPKQNGAAPPLGFAAYRRLRTYR